MLNEFLSNTELLKDIICYCVFVQLFFAFLKFFYHKIIRENPVTSAVVFLILLVLSILVFSEKVNFWWLGGPLFFMIIIAIIDNFKNISINNKVISNLFNVLIDIIQLVFLIFIFINS